MCRPMFDREDIIHDTCNMAVWQSVGCPRDDRLRVGPRPGGAMRALVLTGVESLEVRDVPEPAPDGRALVAVERAGLCGTDLKLHLGKPPVDYPRILGHEMVGHVVRSGRSGRVAEGTRVLVDPTVACGHCHACYADRANLCPRGALIGRDVDGGFADYVAVDDRQLLPLPTSLSLEAATLPQVLGECVH